MDWRINYVDVSSWMLFETVGDSEADSNGNHSDDLCGSSIEDTGLAEDDAFSCSCESDNSYDFDHPTRDYGYVDHDDQKEVEEEKSVDVGHEYYDDQKEVEEEKSVDVGHEYYDEDKDEEEEDAVDQVLKDANYSAGDIKVVMKRNPEGGVLMSEAGQRTKKLKVCGAEFLNEQDNDTHFWETCLAS